MDGGFSVADAIALGRNNYGYDRDYDRDGFLEGNGIIIIILFFLIFGFGGGGFGGWGNGGNALTQAEMQAGFNNQAVLSKLDGINNGICSSGYENARLVDGAVMNMMQSFNNTNSALNDGFNGVQRDLCQGFNGVTASITNLGYQLQQCCCDLKTTMLQDKYEATQWQLEQAQNIISNTNQTQYLLGQLGRFYTYPAFNPMQYYGPWNGWNGWNNNNCNGCNCG